MNETPPTPTPLPRPEGWWERLLAWTGLRASPSTRDELADAIAESAAGELSPHEHTMLQNVLRLRGTRVDDAMVPRADIVAVPAEATLADVLGVFRSAGHSRLPVYGETLDDPRGMVHIRDFVDYLAASAEGNRKSSRRRKADLPNAPSLAGVDLTQTLASARILRPVLYVPPSMPAVDLLVRMQATRTHMALVIDEYGGTDGLVSIEDLVEMVVGDIEDEHDVADAPMIAPLGGDSYAADARASLEEVSALIGVDLRAGELADEVDTIGGLVTTLAGRVPVRGELIAGPDGLEFEITDADARRVKRVRLHRRRVKPAASKAGTATPATPSEEAPPKETASAEEASTPSDPPARETKA